MGSSPPHIAMKGMTRVLMNLHLTWSALNTLMHWPEDCIWTNKLDLGRGKEGQTNLDCKCPDSCNDIKGTVKHMVVRQWWVILPNRIGSFHCCNPCDVIHHGDICKVDNMTETSAMWSDWVSRHKTQERKKHMAAGSHPPTNEEAFAISGYPQPLYIVLCYLTHYQVWCYSSFDLSSIYAVKYHLTMRIRLYHLSFLISTISSPCFRFPALLDLPVI